MKKKKPNKQTNKLKLRFPGKMDEYLNLCIIFTRQNVVRSSFTSFETQIKKREILAVLLIGRAAREIRFDQSESSG